METILPDKEQIKELIQFLPRLYKNGFEPVEKWVGGEKEGGLSCFPWPKYKNDVRDFIAVASKECWCDFNYIPEKAQAMLANPPAIMTSNLKEIRTMLTFCIRGERFCDGHVGAMIKEGKILSILLRLKEILNENWSGKVIVDTELR